MASLGSSLAALGEQEIHVEAPSRLFKYLPSRFVNTFVERGDLLFRNLSYFRKVEERGRKDLLEGLHMDRPNTPITIPKRDGTFWRGRAAFLNSIDPNGVFVFCLAEILSEPLFREFGDACVEIMDPVQFIQRCDAAVGAQECFAEAGLLHGRVEYYAPQRPVVGNVKNPRQIPFFKHQDYFHQTEYRLAMALKGALRLTESIVNDLFSFDDEVADGIEDSRHVFLGSIRDIVKVHYFPSP
jgi:hypothetical protein